MKNSNENVWQIRLMQILGGVFISGFASAFLLLVIKGINDGLMVTLSAQIYSNATMTDILSAWFLLLVIFFGICFLDYWHVDTKKTDIEK